MEKDPPYTWRRYLDGAPWPPDYNFQMLEVNNAYVCFMRPAIGVLPSVRITQSAVTQRRKEREEEEDLGHSTLTETT